VVELSFKSIVEEINNAEKRKLEASKYIMEQERAYKERTAEARNVIASSSSRIMDLKCKMYKFHLVDIIKEMEKLKGEDLSIRCDIVFDEPQYGTQKDLCNKLTEMYCDDDLVNIVVDMYGSKGCVGGMEFAMPLDTIQRDGSEFVEHIKVRRAGCGKVFTYLIEDWSQLTIPFTVSELTSSNIETPIQDADLRPALYNLMDREAYYENDDVM